MRRAALLLAGLMTLAPNAFARGKHATSTTSTTKHRGHHDRLKRDPAQRHRFMQESRAQAGETAAARASATAGSSTTSRR